MYVCSCHLHDFQLAEYNFPQFINPHYNFNKVTQTYMKWKMDAKFWASFIIFEQLKLLNVFNTSD